MNGARWGCVVGALTLLWGCAGHRESKPAPQPEASRPPTGAYKVGKPYRIKDVWYYPAENFAYVETGIASWYGPGFHGRPTAHGEIYDMNELTAAHATLPLPSVVQVTNLDNRRVLKLRVNDRGPFHPGRIIDVSRRAAQLLDFYERGKASVRVEILTDPKADAPESKPEPAMAQSAPTPAPDAVNASAPAPPAPSVASVAILDPLPAPPSPDTAQRPTSQPQRPTPPTYVQAGAFASPENAQQVRERLSALGPVEISALRLQGRDLYRVRLGPLSSPSEADRLLAAAVRAGFPASRLVLE